MIWETSIKDIKKGTEQQTQSSTSGLKTEFNKKVVAAIPCFNTAESIADVVSNAKKYVDEVIVIDDGSTDKTAEIAEASGALVIRHGINKGYGESIKSCFAAARADKAGILVTIDGDGQHDPNQIPRLLAPLIRNSAALVIGSRFLAKDGNIPAYRKFGINLITFIWNFGAKVKVTDTQSGFRAYNQKIINELNLSENGMSISIEILEKIRKKKLNIQEVPISCSYENNNSVISLKAFRHGFDVAFSTLKIRIKTRSINQTEDADLKVRMNN
jgi:glycosyltransferase involved in cell wall biosynthesis